MKSLLLSLPALLLVAGLCLVPLPAQVIGDDTGGGEILTRGPVHEAFAAVVSFRPEPGLIVDRAPPDPIEEVPPDERPADTDAAWIPGYWGWDDERNDFIWISGTWRVLPPGRAWIPGYWGDTGRGWQWVSGYWEDASRREVTYLAPPPETLERGPSSPSPSEDYEWVPGYWEWRDDRYLWRPGYWIEGRADWVWIPSYYVWTPRGYVFVEGYWDYAPEERGLLFAPVYYREHRRSRYEYRPSIVLNVAILADYLFLRPRYSHYYFGDYYDARYESSGFYATYAYQSSRGGYDPFYSYSRWQHRDDRDWDRQYRASYDYRRRNQDARPPRTWSGSALTVNVNVNQGTTQIGGSSRRSQAVAYAQPVQQYAQSGSGGVRLERVAQGESQQQVQVARQIQEQRTQRRTSEWQGGRAATASQSAPAPRPSTSGGQSSVASQPIARAALPVSPIAAREGAGGRQPPPRAQGNRRESGTQSRETSPAAPRGVIGGSSNGSTQTQRNAQPVPTQRNASPESAIGAPAPQPRNEPVRPRDYTEPTDNSRRQEERARPQDQRQAEDAARRNVAQPADQIGAPPREQSTQRANERADQARQRADEQRPAIGAREPASQPQPEANRARDEQQRRDRERQAQQSPREQQQAQPQQRQQEQAQQRQAQPADERQQQAREQQARTAEQAQAREQQARAEEDRGRRAGQERAQQQQEQQQRQQEQAQRQVQQADERQQQAREQQSRANEQSREREAQAAEQARAQQQQQAQAAEQARAQETQAVPPARQQQAQPPPQPDARQKGQPNRQKAQPPPPPPKKEPPKDQPDNSDDDERKKGKG